VSHPRAKVFFCLYLCAIAYLSLFPGQFELHPKADRLFWTPLDGRRPLVDFVLNILFYIPLGISGFLGLQKRSWGWIVAITVGGLLSWTIEWLQLWTPTRFGNLTDLTANVAGTVVGVGLGYVAVRWRLLPESSSTSPWHLSSNGWLLLAIWFLWQMFPFVPAISLRRLTDLPGQFGTWSWLTMVETLVGFAALRFALKNSPWVWIAYASLWAQAFVVERTLSPAALLGASVGWAVAQFSGPSGPRSLGIMLPAWLIFEEFRPFTFSASQQSFSWLPFESWYKMSTLGYYPIIFSKLFLYSAVIWSLRGRDMTWVSAVGIPALILIIGEWAQQYIPGRTPESTDVLVLLAAAVLLAMCGEKAQPKAD
jgi:VanZ family protein